MGDIGVGGEVNFKVFFSDHKFSDHKRSLLFILLL